MSSIVKRKNEHIDIVLNKSVEPECSSFDKYRLPYKALPEINMQDIKMNTKLLGKDLSFPFIISSMTGGLDKGAVINANLAIAAQSQKVALGLGSMRVILEKPETAKSFKVRELCTDIPLFANIGIVQLNYGVGVNEIQKIIDCVEADGIFFHINHLQEAAQDNGDTNFEDLIPKLEKIIKKISVPVLIKEVGHGIDFTTAKCLSEIGVQYIDVSGTGGSSWSLIEGYRSADIPFEQSIGNLFRSVGIPTDEALQQCSKIKNLNLIAGGGIRSGLDVAKAIMLGAKFATAGKPFLAPALESSEKVENLLARYRTELQVAMFCCGVRDLGELAQLRIMDIRKSF